MTLNNKIEQLITYIKNNNSDLNLYQNCITNYKEIELELQELRKNKDDFNTFSICINKFSRLHLVIMEQPFENKIKLFDELNINIFNEINKRKLDKAILLIHSLTDKDWILMLDKINLLSKEEKKNFVLNLLNNNNPSYSHKKNTIYLKKHNCLKIIENNQKVEEILRIIDIFHLLYKEFYIEINKKPEQKKLKENFLSNIEEVIKKNDKFEMTNSILQSLISGKTSKSQFLSVENFRINLDKIMLENKITLKNLDEIIVKRIKV